MRTLFFFLFISLLGQTAALAQRFQAELILGLCGSQISGDQLQGFDKLGVNSGIGVRTAISKNNQVGFRMLYFQKGSQTPDKDIEAGIQDYYLLRLHYLEFPLWFRHTHKERFFVELGPSLAWLIKSYEEDVFGENPYNEPFNSLDLSAQGGLGFKIGGRTEFVFSYWQSLLPVRGESTGGAYYDRISTKQYNSAICFNVVIVLGTD